MMRTADDVLRELTVLCGEIAEGRYEASDRLFEMTGDEALLGDVRALAEAFGAMLVQLEAREFRLTGMLADLEEKNRWIEDQRRKLASENVSLRDQVERLKIEIDERQRDREVADIVQTDYFQTLASRARAMRSRHAASDESTP